MIRLFTILHKTNLNELPDALSIFKAIDKSFHIHSAHCPNCKTKGRLAFHDEYSRNLVAYENKGVQENLITVGRVICSACEETSAILPDAIVPYKSYSIIFILHVLKAYFFRKETVAALCERFGIAVSTLYAWKKRYLSCFTDLLHCFFQRLGFSFLQYAHTTQFGSS